MPVELEGQRLQQFGHVHVKTMDRQRIPWRVSECKMQWKRPVEQPRTKLFSLVMEHTEKRGKSGQDTEKERDWRHLVHWPVWNGKNAVRRRWLNRRRKRWWWQCQWMNGIINLCPCYVEALCTKTDMIWNVCAFFCDVSCILIQHIFFHWMHL